jgi:outer membrane receptor protein involved in Fe transport
MDIVITARRLNEARSSIQTQTGAATYTIDAAAIQAVPGGDNALLNQVVMQAPDVAQDSFGQIHIRGEHNGLQYRLNGVILPEGISAFGQSLDPRLISSMNIITGALPAEYGLRTAGIIDLTTKSGTLEPGGSVSLYGGSHGTFEPSVNYGATEGGLTYFVSASALRNELGVESPDGSANPLHDQSTQFHGFAYLEDILNEENRVSLVLGSSTGKFQIPDRPGLQPSLGLTVNGQSSFDSAALNERQDEVTRFVTVSLQHSAGALDVQTSLTARYTSLGYAPDPLGDLLFTGIAQDAFKKNVAVAWQTDGAYKVSDEHTLRAGLYLQQDRSTSLTSAQVLDLDPLTGAVVPGLPQTIVNNGAQTETIQSLYVQDEWTISRQLTLNYGLRFDHFTAFTSDSQASPRLNLVWLPFDDTTVHAGYSRYLSPPPFELVAGQSVASFNNTTAAAQVTQANLPQAEKSNYFDFGVHQHLSRALTTGLDAYFKLSHNLIDEGQFGAPIIQTPFNYRDGRQYGLEWTSSYSVKQFTAYANLAWQHAEGRGIDSSQFNFSPAELAYIDSHYIHLDHEQQVTASGGVSYLAGDTRLSADFILGSGLRSNLLLADGSSIPNGAHLPYYTQANLGASQLFTLPGFGRLTVRMDLINALDKVYEIRDGTGVGVGAPQFGPRRGLFAGVSLAL